jgi:hypothetical protein
MQPMALNATNTAVTTVSAQIVGSSDIILYYNGLPGNQPANYGNTAYLWQSERIPYNIPPLQQQAILTDTQSGSVGIGNLQLQRVPYIIGYAVGPETANICSWVSIAADRTSSTFETSLEVIDVTSQLVAVRYATPDGNQPALSGQSISLWMGPYASYTQPPRASVQVANNPAKGTLVLQAMIMVGTTYTVGYLMGQKPTTLAASCTFTT